MKIKPWHHALEVGPKITSHHIVFWGDLGRTLTLDLPGEDGASDIGHMDAEFDVTITPIGQEQPKPEPMTIWRAIEILNARKHRYHDDWWWENRGDEPVATKPQGILYDLWGMMFKMTEMEAIAIAEWYERNPEGK